MIVDGISWHPVRPVTLFLLKNRKNFKFLINRCYSCKWPTKANPKPPGTLRASPRQNPGPLTNSPGLWKKISQKWTPSWKKLTRAGSKNHNKSKNRKKSGVISLTKHQGWLQWDLFLVLNKEPTIADLLDPKICLMSKFWSLGKLSRFANSYSPSTLSKSQELSAPNNH